MKKKLFAGAVMIMCHAESFAGDEIYSNIRTAVVSGHGEVLPGRWRVTTQFPKYETNNTDRVLDIDRIEVSDEGTKVFFYFLYYPNYWISIPKDAYLMDSNGTKYNIIESDGIELGGHLYGDDNGQGAFSITFKPLPEDIETIDFRESSSDDSWSIKGIILKPII